MTAGVLSQSCRRNNSLSEGIKKRKRPTSYTNLTEIEVLNLSLCSQRANAVQSCTWLRVDQSNCNTLKIEWNRINVFFEVEEHKKIREIFLEEVEVAVLVYVFDKFTSSEVSGSRCYLIDDLNSFLNLDVNFLHYSQKMVLQFILFSYTKHFKCGRL